MYRGAAQLEDDPLYLPAGQMGYGWWDDAWKETKRVAKQVQSSDAVRGLEKRAVAAGAKALRGAVEGATDGLADTALTAIGAPELVPAADALIDRGAKALQRKGTEYLDQQIDASGRGVRYMAPSGGGLRTSSTRTMVGRGVDYDTMAQSYSTVHTTRFPVTLQLRIVHPTTSVQLKITNPRERGSVHAKTTN